MQQTGINNVRVSRLRVSVLVAFAALTILCFVRARAFSVDATPNNDSQQSPQNLQTNQRRTPAARNSAPRYSAYSHDIPGHGSDPKSCAACHRVDSQQRPDLTEYPDHPSCIKCHRQQFFNGARPTICSVCHANASPRNGIRFSFPIRTRASQFTDIFPHRAHLSSSTRTAFAKLPDAKKKALTAQETCAHCHRADKTAVNVSANVVTAKETFVPPPE